MLKIFTEKNFSIFRIFATIAIGSINIPHMHSVPVRREPEKNSSGRLQCSSQQFNDTLWVHLID
jgi:hypothetical protein